MSDWILALNRRLGCGFVVGSILLTILNFEEFKEHWVFAVGMLILGILMIIYGNRGRKEQQ